MNAPTRLSFALGALGFALAMGACDVPPEPGPMDPERISQAYRLPRDTPLTVAATGRARTFTLSYTDASGRKQCVKNPTIGDLLAVPQTSGSEGIDPVCRVSDLGCVITLTANCPFDSGVECSFDTCGCGTSC